jgi:predicted AAA+ superfamily ATPase
MAVQYLPRLVDRALSELLSDVPAVLVVGPRACGKTTSAARVCSDRLRLDRIEDRTAVRLDPDRAITRSEPVLIDEWQLEPEVLAAVKRAVDDDFHPGRFVLTGSARSDMTASGWPATGRVVRLDMWGLTAREMIGTIDTDGLVDRVVAGGAEALIDGPEGVAADDLIDLAFRGTSPQMALAGSDRSRRSLLAGYVDQLVSRDAGSMIDIDPVRLKRYLQAIAANTAGIPTHKSLYDAAQIDRQTALRYDSVLELVMATEQLPAWASNQMARLVQLPKRHLIDVGLVQVLIGIDARRARRDADLLGRVLESFVAAQLRPEVAVATNHHQLFHLRTANGRLEVDLLAELDDGRLIGIEVKAERAPDAGSARHLVSLRDTFGQRFIGGIVLHAGPRRYRIDDRIVAAPISALWDP